MKSELRTGPSASSGQAYQTNVPTTVGDLSYREQYWDVVEEAVQDYSNSRSRLMSNAVAE